MLTIEYGNVTCRVNGLEEYKMMQYEICERLSYEIGGFGQPKETKYLFNPSTNITYTGLIPYIINIIKNHGLNVQLIDRRVEPEQNASFKLADNITPRDYQQHVFDNKRSRMIVQMATGAGKTLVLAGMIAEFNVKPAIIISPKATLAYQLRNEVQKFLGTEVGIMTGSDNDVRDITVATPQMALKSEVLKEAKILLVDECQFLGSHTLFSVARMAKNAYYRIAVSATPWRDGDDDILVEAAINVRNPKSNINASTLINKGKLTPCEINFVKQNDNCGWMGSYAKTYDAAIVNNKSRNNKILNIVKDCIKNDRGSILILINKIGHGNKILEAIKSEIGVHEEIVVMNGKEYKVNSVEFISGCTDMETRNVILQGAREEKVKILIGSTIADEGLDCPALKVLILAGAGKSSTRAFQRVGRVLRLFNGRTKAYIYDFIDENMTFYKHFMYRKALYSTEPEWKKNMKVVNF